MKRFIPLLIAALTLTTPVLPARADAPPVSDVAPRFADALRDALHSGEWAKVRRLFHTGDAPALIYLAQRWDDVRAGRLDPVRWEVTFEPYRSGATEVTGQLSVAARVQNGDRVGHRFDVSLVRLGNAWLVGESIAYALQETRLTAHALSLDLRRYDHLMATDALTLEATGPDREVYLRIHPNLAVSAVRFGDQPLAFVQRHEVIYFQRPEGKGPFVVSIAYGGRLPQSDWDFVRESGSVLRSEFLWYPRPAIGSSFTPFTVAVTVPPNRQVEAVGEADGMEEGAEGWTYRFSTSKPVEGMSVYAGAFQKAEGLAGPVAITAYTEKGREQAAPIFLAEAARVLDFYGDRYGKYPFRKLALVETDFPGGYGATSAVALPHAAFDTPAIADEFLAHELAHNWTDRVAYKGELGEKGFMAEGVASYLDLLYHGARDGAVGFRKRLQAVQRRYQAVVGTAGDRPIAEADQDDRALWQTLTYDKGALVLHMLRREIGDGAFDKGLKDLYATHEGKPIGLDDFQASFDKACGKNMGYFFRQWLTRPGVAMLETEDVRTKAIGGGKYEVSGVIVQRTLPYVLGVPVVVVSDQGQLVYQVPVRSFQTPFRLRVPGKPRVLMIDPLHDALIAGAPPVPLK